MIVYGQPQRREATADLLTALRRQAAVLARATGEERWAQATRLLIDAGELAQGLLDAAFSARGFDEWETLEECVARLTLQAARVMLSEGPAAVGPLTHALEDLCRLPLPETVLVKVPEGYAFYALYPEQYAGAATRFRAAYRAPLAVIGLRSIGTGLAAVVAAAGALSRPPVTLRPVGHPFRRQVRVGPRLARLLLDLPAETHYAIVDEGPGLSGSSFGAAADWLEEGGVAPERIHFFPGHGGDLGPQASPRHRERWRRAARHLVPFEQLSPAGGEDLEDAGGGGWRAKLFAAERDWPPANPTQERRKYLCRGDGPVRLLKFAGLGRYGDAALARAGHLERAGMIPRVVGLRRGFLVSEWLGPARPLSGPWPHERSAVLRRIGDYLALLGRDFPAGDDAPGASPEGLLHMAKVNTAEWFGPDLAGCLDPWEERLRVLRDRLRRVRTDNRMHRWEWLQLPDGRILKTDALEHHAAHDCIGAQDLAWDVVGAAVEWELTPAEQEDLDRRLAPYRPDPLVRAFYLPCYLAFQMGYYRMAADALTCGQPEEASRLRAQADRYALRLRRALAAPDGEGPG